MRKKKEVLVDGKVVNYDRAKWWQVMLFQVNNAATNIHFIFFLYYFLVYTTDSLGLAAVITGAMMTVARLLDAITDPIIGMWIDRTDSKFGKFRPFMAAGSIILTISLIAMFWGVKFQSNFGYYAYIGIWYVVWVIGYTLQATCTKGAKAILTNDPKQRSLGQGYDAVFNTIVGVAVVIGVPILLKTKGITNASTWKTIAIGIAIVSSFLTIVSMLAIWSKDNNKHYTVLKNKVSLKEYIPLLKNNKALKGLLIAASTNKLAGSVYAGVGAYLYIYIMGDIGLQSKVGMIGLPIGILGAIVGTIIAIKISKKASFIFGTWASIAVNILILIIRPFSMQSFTIFIAFMALITMFNNLTQTTVGGMIADVVDYEHWQSGKFMPGMVSTGFSLVDKLMSSLSGLVIGGTLAIVSFVAGMELTPGLFWGIMFLMFLIPLFGHIASILGMKLYPIDRKFYNKIRKEIDEREAIKEN